MRRRQDQRFRLDDLIVGLGGFDLKNEACLGRYRIQQLATDLDVHHDPLAQHADAAIRTPGVGNCSVRRLEREIGGGERIPASASVRGQEQRSPIFQAGRGRERPSFLSLSERAVPAAPAGAIPRIGDYPPIASPVSRGSQMPDASEFVFKLARHAKRHTGRGERAQFIAFVAGCE